MLKKVVEILEKSGPMLSGQLAKIYEKKYNVSNVNAKKAISRAKKPVLKSKSIPFASNQSFVYLQKDENNKQYWDSLFIAISEHSNYASAIIFALIGQGGIMSKNLLPAYSISPTEKLIGHRLYEDLQKQLKDSKIILDYDDDYIELNKSFPIKRSPKFSHSKGIELAKELVLADFNDMLRKTNAISYDKGKEWNDFSKFRWAFTAPSYVHGISMWNSKERKLKPGFFIADIVLQKNASKQEVSFFTEKINIIKSFKNASNFIPVLIVYSLDNEALEFLKKNQVIIAFIDRLFGDDYKILLDDLINIMTKATEMVRNNPEKIDRFFNNMAKQDGRYNNIVGDLFEYMVADLQREIGVRDLEMNINIPAQKTKSGWPKEVDILISKNGSIYIIECKATKSMIDEDEIDKWLSTKIVDAHYFFRYEYPQKPFVFQFWSVGGFTDKAIEKLESAQQLTKKYGIDFYDKTRMLKFANDNNAKVFVRRINEHFR